MTATTSGNSTLSTKGAEAPRPPDATRRLAERLGEQLQNRGWRVATAESCTGGGIAAALTEVAGSSAWFEYGLVTYANRAKQQLLGVSEQSLAQEGAVSEAVVREMAEGALHLSGAELAIAVSGVAGPGGGTPEKPVGTVWLGWAQGGEAPVTGARCYRFEGDRAQVREQTVIAALEILSGLAGP
ncbi:CinA family protein [Marinimicrobium locisalis]|uniref:CinA family protein n=1 Tax=Marinimicrobium locisalis TaxID=546022 RepID=UPI003221532D